MQASAAVEACATLDDATRSQWYDLAHRIVAYVSNDGATLAAGQLLKIELGGMLVHLQAKGCGNVAKDLRDAPPETQAPPPRGTPNPLFGALGTLSELLPWALAALVIFELRGNKR